MFTDLIVPKNLKDFCAVRERCLEMVAQADRLLKAADDDMREIYPYGMPWGANLRESVSRITAQVDRVLWRRAFDLTGFSQYMDAKARREFDHTLDENPPVFCEENIRSIFLDMQQQASGMFMRGIVEVFRYLSPEYKAHSNEPFKIPEKIIMRNTTETWLGLRISTYGADRINDIDRVFKTLDDVEFTPRSLESAINTAFKDGNEYNDDYYKVRGYRNGNVHMWFKRRDLLDKANDLIIKWYGENKLAGTAA